MNLTDGSHGPGKGVDNKDQYASIQGCKWSLFLLLPIDALIVFYSHCRRSLHPCRCACIWYPRGAVSSLSELDGTSIDIHQAHRPLRQEAPSMVCLALGNAVSWLTCPGWMACSMPMRRYDTCRPNALFILTPAVLQGAWRAVVQQPHDRSREFSIVFQHLCSFRFADPLVVGGGSCLEY